MRQADDEARIDRARRDGPLTQGGYSTFVVDMGARSA